MRHLSLPALLCLLAAGAFAYEGTSFSPLVANPNLDKFELVPAPSGKKSACLWMNGPRLSAQWKKQSFSFTSEGSGKVRLRVRPAGQGDIPYYYDDIRINGVPLDFSSGWRLEPPLPPDGLQFSAASFTGNPCLKLYQQPCAGAGREIDVKQGERVEVTMMARCGSVLEAYAASLEPVKANLDESLKLDSAFRGDALAKCLDELAALSQERLHVAVPALTSTVIPALRAKTQEFVAAYQTELARTAKDELPALYDNPKARAELKDKLLEARRLSAALKTDCVLAFILGGK